MLQSNYSFLTAILIYVALNCLAILTVSLKKWGHQLSFILTNLASMLFFALLFSAEKFELGESFLIEGNQLLLLKMVTLLQLMMIWLNGHTSSLKLKSTLLLSFMFLGGIFLLGARDLITFYVAMETIALLGYVLVATSELEFSKEAAVKYLIQGSIVSCLFLLGSALYLGATGTLSLHQAVVSNQELYAMSLGLISLTLFFKMGAFPFHSWIADVYSNVTDGNLAANFFISKIIIGFKFMTMIQFLLLDANPHFQEVIIRIIQIIAVLSAFYGNMMAVVQNQFKRIIAYSSVAHTGYMLLMVCLTPDDAYEKQLISFLMLYSLTATGVILILNQFAKCTPDAKDKSTILKGGFYQNKALALLLLVFVLSLAGIPLTSGFALKYALFTNFYREGFALEATSILISSIIGLSYYIRFMSDLFEQGESPKIQLKWSETVIHAIILLAIFSVGLFPSIFFELK